MKTKSGHQKFRSPDGERTVIVPVHGKKPLAKGLFLRLLKDTGLETDDF